MQEHIGMKKGDIIIISIAIISIFLLWLILYNQKNGNLVCVTIQEQEFTFSLSEKQRIDLSDLVAQSKGKNVICIEDGMVYMEYADCPDQICVKHKAISKNGEMIVCLPNDVILRVENTTKNTIDN